MLAYTSKLVVAQCNGDAEIQQKTETKIDVKQPTFPQVEDQMAG